MNAQADLSLCSLHLNLTFFFIWALMRENPLLLNANKVLLNANNIGACTSDKFDIQLISKTDLLASKSIWLIILWRFQ